MMKPNGKTMEVTCWRCTNHFYIQVTPDSHLERKQKQDQKPNKEHTKTVRLECPLHDCQILKDSKGPAINMVDGFVGTILGTELEWVVKAEMVAKKADIVVNGRPATANEEDWVKLNTEQRRSSITLQNDAAKLLFAFPTTITTLYLGLIGGISATAAKALNLWSIAPIFAWVLGGGCAMFTFFPWISKVDPNSPTSIWGNHNRTVARKFWILAASVSLFVIGLGLAAWRITVLINSPTK